MTPARGRPSGPAGPDRRFPGDGRIGPAAVAAVLALLAALPTSAAAQDVDFSPRADRPEERRLDRFLETSDFRMLTRDTVVARADTVAGSLLVLEAAVRLEGRVEGDVWVVGGDLFLRPGARVGGDVAVLGGGWYASSLAEVDGEVLHRPNLLLRAVRRDGRWEIRHVAEERDVLELHGLSGFHAPLYRRVSGWTFGWGGRVQAVDAPWQPSLEAEVRFNTEGTGQLEGTARQFWHPTGEFRFGLEAERAVRSNEAWIASDVPNSLRYLLSGEDLRDYYRSERATFLVGWPARQGWGGSVSVNWEQARSLEARPLAVLFDDDADVRPNPSVDEGKIWSLEAALGYRRRAADRRLQAELRVEAADSATAGDFSFLRGQGRISWRRPGLTAGHRLELLGIGRVDLAGDLPRQRWSSLGGDGTLPTIGELERRGARMFFLRTTYLVPVEPLRIPVAGVPRVFLRNAVGAAWNEGADARVEDNVSAGVRFLFLEAGIAVNPTRSDMDPSLLVQGVLPARFWP